MFVNSDLSAVFGCFAPKNLAILPPPLGPKACYPNPLAKNGKGTGGRKVIKDNLLLSHVKIRGVSAPLIRCYRSQVKY